MNNFHPHIAWVLPSPIRSSVVALEEAAAAAADFYAWPSPVLQSALLFRSTAI